jgi:hypothetical protein
LILTIATTVAPVAHQTHSYRYQHKSRLIFICYVPVAVHIAFPWCGSCVVYSRANITALSLSLHTASLLVTIEV